MVWSDLTNFRIKYKLGLISKGDFTKKEFEFWKKTYQCSPEDILRGSDNYNTINNSGETQNSFPEFKNGIAKYVNKKLGQAKDVITARSFTTGWRGTVAKHVKETMIQIRGRTGSMYDVEVPTSPFNTNFSEKVKKYLNFEGQVSETGEDGESFNLGQVVKGFIGSTGRLGKGGEKMFEVMGTRFQALNAKTWSKWNKNKSDAVTRDGKSLETKKKEVEYEWDNYSKAQQLVQRGSSFLNKTFTPEERIKYGKMGGVDADGKMLEDNHLKDFEEELGTLHEVILEDRAESLKRKMSAINNKNEGYDLKLHAISSYVPGNRSRGEFVSSELSPTAQKLGVLNKMTGLMNEKNIEKLYFTKEGQPLDVAYDKNGKPTSYMLDGKEIKGEPSLDNTMSREKFKEKYEEKGTSIEHFYESNLSEEESGKLKGDRGSILEDDDYLKIATEEFNNKTKHAYYNAVGGDPITVKTGGGRSGMGFNLIGEQSHHLLVKSIMGNMFEDEAKERVSLRIRDNTGKTRKSESWRLQDRDNYLPNDPQNLVMMNEEYHQDIIHNSLESTMQLQDIQSVEEGKRVQENRTLFMPDTIQVPNGLDENGNTILWRQHLTPKAMEKFLKKHPEYANKVLGL